ncbi:alpha/beta fold hydrolase [Roseivivax sp. CAU 1753]
MVSFYHGLVGDHRHFATARSQLPDAIGTVSAPDMPFLDVDYPEILERYGAPSPVASVRVGNSIGCGVALHAAGPHDQVILTAPSFDFSTGMVPLRKALVGAWVTELYVRHGEIPNEAEFLDHAKSQMLQLLGSRRQIKRLRSFRAIAQSFWSDPALARHEDRITFVIGAADFTTPPDAFRAYVSAHLPKARVEVWTQCGHAVPLDAAGRLATLIGRRWGEMQRDVAVKAISV